MYMTERRKQVFVILLPVLICLVGMIGITAFWSHAYRAAAFQQLSQFCEMLIEDAPETELLVISNAKKYLSDSGKDRFSTNNNINHTADVFQARLDRDAFLTQYGYRSSAFDDGPQQNLIFLTLALFFVMVLSFLSSLWYLDRRKRERIAELTDYLEQVNTGAGGTLIQVREDEFSHLQDELYKTVTALYQTRDAAVKAKMNFADNLTNIAHQIKTPLTASFLSLQLMEKAHPNRYAQQIERQLKRLDKLEGALLMLAKIDAGTLQLERSPVDVYTVLCLAAENLNDLLERAGIAVSIPENGCIEFAGDLEWSMEACVNLMKNCMEHSSPGGTIHCAYSRNPLYTEILIWDEGTGFAAGDMPHLFERFYRGNGAVGDGIGIGLSLARAIFALQNGNITARNLPEGGACFEIRVYRNNY